MLPALSVLALAACVAPPAAKMDGTSPDLTSYGAPPEAAGPLAPGAAQPKPGVPSLADLARGPQRFEGLQGKAVLAALGNPNFRRRERPAEVWQYYGPGCILDLFLYDDTPAASKVAGKPVEGTDLDGKVAHAELRGREGQPAEATCLSRLIGQRRAMVSG